MFADPHDVSAAASLLPFWVRWGGLFIAAATALLAAGVGGWAAAHIALWRVRRLGDAPWPERARVAFSAKRAMASSGSALPFLCGAVACVFSGPFSVVPGAALGVIAWTVGLAVGLCWYRYVAQRVRESPLLLRRALRGGASVALIFMSPLAPVIAAVPLMPRQLGADAFAAVVLVALGVLLFACGGGVWIARRVGLVRPASARLAGIVAGVALRVGVPVRATYEVEWPTANAFALPLWGSLLFTDRAVALLPDDAIAAVAAHELGHLTEPRRVILARVLRSLLLVALVLLIPVINTYGWSGLLYVLLPMLVIGRVYARFSRRLEARADAVGHACTADGVFARALETIHRANLLPVVFGKGATHPDLYDRMLAAGVTPAYPRPQRPSRVVGPAALAAALAVGAAIIMAAPLSLLLLSSRAPTDPARLHAALLLDRAGHAGTIAALANLRAARGDEAAAATLYRAAAHLAPWRWSAAAYRATALALGDRCGDAQRLLAAALDAFARRYGDDRRAPSLLAAQTAVRACSSRHIGEPDTGGTAAVRIDTIRTAEMIVR